MNTFSMFWPLGENVVVHGDHMDIVGHFRRLPAAPGGGRRYRMYDHLKSDSGFDKETFHGVWTDIFNFALGRTYERELAAAGARGYWPPNVKGIPVMKLRSRVECFEKAARFTRWFQFSRFLEGLTG